MIVDDDALVRLGLADLIGAQPDMAVVAQAEDGLTALNLATAHQPDIALIDIRMPRMDGIRAAAAMRQLPHPPRVIVLTTFDVDEYVYDALAAGADGFLLKDTNPKDIVHAIHVVAAGSAMLHPRAARRLVDHFHHTAPAEARQARERISTLTPRERSVLELVAVGASNSEIAAQLAMQESTVKAHVSRILTALNVNNRVQAALRARDAGL
ncbi:response regulator transcription factor [Mycolicibacterium sp. BiH015]|nr:response regulator transcription factor [Mycolicibacterium sp. BiH015]